MGLRLAGLEDLRVGDAHLFRTKSLTWRAVRRRRATRGIVKKGAVLLYVRSRISGFGPQETWDVHIADWTGTWPVRPVFRPKRCALTTRAMEIVAEYLLVRSPATALRITCAMQDTHLSLKSTSTFSSVLPGY
ncbi:hypothetical protein PV04_07186 [Phialophora macrospora]|uniref:Uncharacterized protein n=1 Tax=Phialophora macrospora TaxID=1851006 RepID=A0A0D2DRQ8_9EURO|nr:hypothetical protein PV04_07186 [Phialophora macrospora]